MCNRQASECNKPTITSARTLSMAFRGGFGDVSKILSHFKHTQEIIVFSDDE